MSLLVRAVAPLLTLATVAFGAVRIAHVTDMHIDPAYVVGSDPTVPGRGCHDPIPPGSTGITPAGQFGDVHCDSPPVLVNSAVDSLYKAAMRADGQEPAVALYWTGDDVAHLLYNETTLGIVTDGIRRCADALGGRFAAEKGLAMVASLGNHDCFPTDQFTPAMPLYSTIAEIFEGNGFLDRDTEAWDTFLRGGYYAKNVTDDIVALSLNTILWYAENAATDPSDGGNNDPAGQFAWLENMLGDAREKGKTVHLLGHVPPGFDENSIGGTGHMHEAFNERFVSILAANADLVQAGFYGHEHTDAFRALVGDLTIPGLKTKNSARGVVHYAFLAPAITPWANSWHLDSPSNNPSPGRVYTVGTRVPAAENPFGAPSIGYDQLWTNLTLANERGVLEWGLEYAAGSTYGGHLSAAGGVNWISLASAILTRSTPEFDTYRRLNMVSRERPNGARCDEKCAARMACATVCGLRADMEECEDDPAGYAARLGGEDDARGGVRPAVAAGIFFGVLAAAAAAAFAVTMAVKRSRAEAGGAKDGFVNL